MPNVALEPVAGKPLIDYTLDVAISSGVFEHIFVYTDDQKVVDHCSGLPNVIAELRDPQLSDIRSRLAHVLNSAVETLESAHDIHPDIVTLLSIHAPLRESRHIQKAIDTLLLYDVDNVISTYEDRDLHFSHGKDGLKPLNPGTLAQLRFERESLFVDNGAVHAFWRDAVGWDDLYQGRIGHIVMPRDQSHQIKSAFDKALVELTLRSDRFGVVDE